MRLLLDVPTPLNDNACQGQYKNQTNTSQPEPTHPPTIAVSQFTLDFGSRGQLMNV